MLSYNDLNINYQGGDLNIRIEDLISLTGCPQHITGDFICYRNDLTSLIGGPQKVDGDYICYSNKLTDLVGCASHIGGKLQLKSNELDRRPNKITSLVGIHKIIKSCGTISFNPIDIHTGGIGLLLIGNLTTILSYNKPFAIINSYLGEGTKGMMECRAELIAKGYSPYAIL